MERGIVSVGRDLRTGDHNRPKLELTRLAVSRCVYAPAHMDIVAGAVESVYAQRESAKGLVMTYEPRYLRLLQARFDRPQPAAAQRPFRRQMPSRRTLQNPRPVLRIRHDRQGSAL
jgi:hypothetical protein